MSRYARAPIAPVSPTGTGEAGTDWRGRAACRNYDPELWFDDTEWAKRVGNVALALKVCAGCPVVDACLAWVMAMESPSARHGIAGGLTAPERSSLARKQYRAAENRVMA